MTRDDIRRLVSFALAGLAAGCGSPPAPVGDPVLAGYMAAGEKKSCTGDKKQCSGDKKACTAAAPSAAASGRASSGGRSPASVEPGVQATFPWPPPEPSARTPIAAAALGIKAASPLRDVGATLATALRSGGYAALKWYRAPGGFVIATKMERIDATGTPALKRFEVTDDGPDDLLPMLLLPQAPIEPVSSTDARYRAMAIVVSDAPTMTSGTAPSMDDAKDWIAAGAAEFPEDVARVPFSGRHKIDLLIYEFAPTPKLARVHSVRSGLSLKDHLRVTGLWAAFRLK